ncbi:MAG: hypothetical protein ACFBZ8_07535 [Opitutales bacterium]
MSRFIDFLEQNPFDEGDYSEDPATGRRICVKLVEGWAVSYWPDHRAREVRILQVARADHP